MKKSFLLVCSIISILLSVGYFKPGIDVISYYSFGSQAHFNKLFAVGSYISTLIINGRYIGVEICTLLMTSAIYLFFTRHSTSNITTKVLFVSVTIMSWPCYPLATNTLRQGLSISLLLLLLSIWSQNSRTYQALKVLLLALTMLTHIYAYILILSLMVSLSIRYKLLKGYGLLLMLAFSTIASLFIRSFAELSWLKVENTPQVTIVLVILNILFFGNLSIFDKRLSFVNDLDIIINMSLMLTLIGVYLSYFGIFALSERVLMFPTVVALILSILYVLNCKIHPRKELLGAIYISIAILSGITYFLMN